MIRALKENNSIHFARSLEDVKQIVLSHEKKSFKYIFLRACISVRVFFSNSLLGIIRFLLFKREGCARQDFNNIIIYTVGLLGDNIAILPAIAAFRRRYPSSRITVINNVQIWNPQSTEELYSSLSYIDNFIVIKNYDCPVQRQGLSFRLVVEELKDMTCDLFVNLSPFGNRGWFGAVLREMIFARMIGAKKAVGFRVRTYRKNKIFNKVQIHFMKNVPRMSRYILKELDIYPIENEDILPKNDLIKSNITRKMSFDETRDRPFIVMNPGGKYKVKYWPAERFGRVAKIISEKYDLNVILTGITTETNIAEEVTLAADKKNILNLVGKTNVFELIEILRLAKGCITNDTGTMHIAAMLGIPTVAIFTSRESPLIWFPLGKNVIAIYSFHECSYCYDDQCQETICTKSIQLNDVLYAFEKIMN